jgi:hypothetical protein
MLEAVQQGRQRRLMFGSRDHAFPVGAENRRSSSAPGRPAPPALVADHRRHFSSVPDEMVIDAAPSIQRLTSL